MSHAMHTTVVVIRLWFNMQSICFDVLVEGSQEEMHSSYHSTRCFGNCRNCHRHCRQIQLRYCTACCPLIILSQLLLLSDISVEIDCT